MPTVCFVSINSKMLVVNNFVNSIPLEKMHYTQTIFYCYYFIRSVKDLLSGMICKHQQAKKGALQDKTGCSAF